MRFGLEDFEGAQSSGSRCCTEGSVPDLFRTGRDVVVTGTERPGGLFVTTPGLDDHEVPVEVPGRRHSVLVPAQAMQSMSQTCDERRHASSSGASISADMDAPCVPRLACSSHAWDVAASPEQALMAELGRAALLVTLGLSVYALARRARRMARKRRLSHSRGTRSSPRSSRRSSRHSSCRGLRPGRLLARVRGGAPSEALPLQYKISAFWGGQEGSLLLWLLALTGYAASRCGSRGSARTSSCGSPRSSAGSRLASRGSWWPSEPVRHDRRAGRRERAQPEPPEPVHGRPSGRSLPRVRRPRGAVRLRDGSAPLRRTDERWIVATRRWTIVAWTALGIGSCSVPTGRTRRWAGAATTPGIRSRTRR